MIVYCSAHSQTHKVTLFHDIMAMLVCLSTLYCLHNDKCLIMHLSECVPVFCDTHNCDCWFIPLLPPAFPNGKYLLTLPELPGSPIPDPCRSSEFSDWIQWAVLDVCNTRNWADNLNHFVTALVCLKWYLLGSWDISKFWDNLKMIVLKSSHWDVSHWIGSK